MEEGRKGAGEQGGKGDRQEAREHCRAGSAATARTWSRERPVYVNIPRCSSTRRQSLAPPGGGLSTRSSAACSARRMPCSRAAIPSSSMRHAAHRSGSPRMVATSAAPCCGGDECVSRIVRRSCCPSLSAMAASWQLPTQGWGGVGGREGGTRVR